MPRFIPLMREQIKYYNLFKEKFKHTHPQSITNAVINVQIGEAGNYLKINCTQPDKMYLHSYIWA